MDTFKKPTSFKNHTTTDVENLCVKNSSTVSTTVEISSDDASRKKSAFLITRIDRASISSALEAESDMENEYVNDRGTNCQSPGSNSLISVSSGAFEDGTSTMTDKVVPHIAVQNATPNNAASKSDSTTPSVDFKHPVPPLSIVQEQRNISPIAGQSSSLNSNKDSISSAASSSRFHIITLDSGPYKRGRWNCRDFDESSNSSAVRSDMIFVGRPRSANSSCSSGRNSYHIADENTKTDGSQTPVLISTTTNEISFEQRIHQKLPPENGLLNSSGENSIDPKFQRQRHFSSELIATAKVDLQNSTATVLVSEKDRLVFSTNNLDGEIEKSSMAFETLQSTDGTIGLDYVQQGGPGSAAAIDNKIEQAMDLVKTHLLYAVREEVEVLKEKIIDLEKKVYRLESENKFLREYAPPEILQQIQQNGGQAAVASSLTVQQQSIGGQSASPDSTLPQQAPAVSNLDSNANAISMTGETTSSLMQ